MSCLFNGFQSRRLVAALLVFAGPAALAAEQPRAAPPAALPSFAETLARLPALGEMLGKTPRAPAATVDPTQPKGPLASLYSMNKSTRGQELPSLELKGRILSGGKGAALLGIEGQTQPIVVREGAKLICPGAKHAGLRLHVVKVDDVGVQLEILREGQDTPIDEPLLLY